MSVTQRRAARLWAACTLLPLAALGAVPPAPGTPLDQLMGLLAQQRHARADFQEQQYLAVLTRPLLSSGILIYDAPDHLEQRTLRPRRQTMVLDHGVLTLQVGRHRRSVPLADYPQLAPLIDSIRATLAGDRAALEQVFNVQLHGNLDRWQLQLQPRAGQPAGAVTQIVIAGTQARISEVQVRQSDGDHSVLQIRPQP
jgi:hypothetical protein